MKPANLDDLLSHERAALLAASATEVGLALVQGEASLLWANPCFTRLARALGCSPEQLAKREADEASQQVRTPEGQAWQLRWREARPSGEDGASLFLVEAVPQCLSDTMPLPAEGELDSLTGVLNRQGLERELLQWFEAASTRPFALVFLDLDDFKTINDEQGHLAGDERLRQVGDRLRGAVRSGDAVGRFGGDEFVVLVSGIAKEGDLQHVSERLSTVGKSKDRPLGVSLGSALSSEGYENPQAMLHAADRRMYAAKRAKNP